jgi:WD40-like Beta Propeller Repeat
MRLLVVGFLLVAACEHAGPAGTGVLDPLGPRTSALPRRLTYSPGDDRHPAASDSRIAFSRLDPGEVGGERCLAFLPVEGGTIDREFCPPPPLVAADTFVDTWTEPAFSPDGKYIAYLWQQGSLVSVLGFWSTSIVVAPAERAGDRSGFVWPIHYVAPSGRIGDAVSAITWADPGTLRFLIGYEFIFKVKGGGLIRYTDTTFQSYGLAELDIGSATLRLVPGGDSVVAYAVAPDGGLWLARSDQPQELQYLAPGSDTPTAVATFAAPIAGLAAVDGRAVALVSDSAVVWIEPGDSTGHALPVGPGVGPVRRIAAVPGTRRFVVEIERGRDLFGDPANLWLYELP